MIDAAAKAYAATVRPALEASETKQGLAKLLRQAAVPLVRVAKPRSAEDVDALDALVAAALAGVGIRPVSNIGQFARKRVREVAMLPWQIMMFGTEEEEAASEVTILGSADITTGGSYTAAAGSNRAVVACVGALGTGAPSAATFGGVAMTQAVVADGDNRRTVIYYLLEASIPGGSQALAVTSTGITDTWIGRIFTLDGVNQSTPTRDTAIASDPDGVNDPEVATSSLGVEVGDMTLTVIAQRADKTAGLAAAPSFTTDRMTFSGATTRGVAHRAEASTTSYTPEWEHGLGGAFNESSVCWAVFRP